MPNFTPAAITDFLKSAKDLSLGYSEINFLQPAHIPDGQIGYSDDLEGGWRNEWVVIANDQSGDPFFVDTGIDVLPVFTAIHGEGSWEPTRIADSLEAFAVIVEKLRGIASGRESPAGLERDPIPKKELAGLLQDIESANPSTELWYWEEFLQQE